MKDIIITNDKDKIIETYQKEQVEYTNKFIDMQEEIERLNKINKKAKRQIEILLELALEQDSENVNLIDRLRGILDILGSDKG